MREPNKLCRQLTMNTFVCGTLGYQVSFVDNLQWTPLCAVGLQYKAAKHTKRIPTELIHTNYDRYDYGKDLCIKPAYAVQYEGAKQALWTSYNEHLCVRYNTRQPRVIIC